MCASFSLWGKLWSKFGDNGIVTPPHTGSDRPACHQIHCRHRRHHHHHNHYQHHHRCFCNFIIRWKFVFSGICAHVGGIIRFLSMSGVDDRLGPDSKDNKKYVESVWLQSTLCYQQISAWYLLSATSVHLMIILFLNFGDSLGPQFLFESFRTQHIKECITW